MKSLQLLLPLCALAACSVVTPPPPPDGARITRFEASTTRISAGEQVTLSFTTERAETLELQDDHGRAIQLDGEIGEGHAVVAPTASTFYVLRALGPGGSDSAFVQVAVDEPLQELFLLAVPPVIDSGQSSQLLWGATGARGVVLETDGSAAMSLSGTSGTIAVHPTRTTGYRLVATTSDGTKVTTEAIIDVRPVLDAFTVSAVSTVEPGESLRLAWRSHGGLRVSVTERVFGAVFSSADQAIVDDGSATFVIPTTLPTGLPLTDGTQLEFTVRIEGAQSAVTGTGSAVLGAQPLITELDFPATATAAGTFRVNWQTAGAEQITITFAGQTVFATQPGEQLRVAHGSVVLSSPSAAGEYVFSASSQGITNSVRTQVALVAPPMIGSFTHTAPARAAGVATPLVWTTAGATRLQLSVENGPTFAVITDAARLSSGTEDLRPLTPVTVTLEAFNAAGDVVRASEVVPVSSTANVTVTPSPAPVGAFVNLAWDLTPSNVTGAFGLGQDVPAGLDNSTAFIDLAARAGAHRIVFADSEDGVEQLTRVEGFRFPLMGAPRDQFFVGVNGFVAFAAPPSGLAMPQAIGLTSNAAPALVAPYWADLKLTDQSAVRWAVVPTQGGERALIVQWNQMQLGADAASTLTFQVQLGESGWARFVYGPLTGAVVDLAQVTIGVRDARLGLSWTQNGSPATHVLASSKELLFSAVDGPSGSFAITADKYGPFSFLARAGNDLFVASPVVRAFKSGDVTIAEAMPLAAGGLPRGQWFELRNDTANAVELEGLMVQSDSAADAGFALGPKVLAPRARYLLGQSLDLSDTDGAPVEQVCNLAITTTDRLRLFADGTAIASLSWSGVMTADSVMLDPGFLQTADAGVACPRTDSFGSGGAHGTPGTAEPQCGPYRVTQIASGFLAPPSDAGVLTHLDGDEGFGTLLLPTPFTYFGNSYDRVQVSQNGFLAFGATLSSGHRTNATGLSTLAPNGVVAPFWDDLQRELDGGLSMWRTSDRIVISWSGYRFSGTAVGVATLDVQVHLRDDGSIEFHYGRLQAGPWALSDSAARLGGNSATIGIERPDGRVLIPWSINGSRAVSPAMGLRFTPN